MTAAPFELESAANALVLGAGHGIGFAIAQRLIDTGEMTVFATYRCAAKATPLLELARESSRLLAIQADPCEELQIEALFENIRGHTDSLDLVLNCVGVLHDGMVQPEKAVRSIDLDALMQYFLVNAVLTPVLAKHAHPLLRGESPSVFAAISARVGSISDNRLGGWYGYRASKAAMNMFLRALAIEFKAPRTNCVVLALHPGTTRTALSAPFIERTHYVVHTPYATAKHMLRVIAGKTIDDTGSFYAWDGERLEW